MKMRLQHGILLGLAASATALILSASGILDRLENITWDWRVRRMARSAPTTESVRLIFLDQASLDWAAEHLGLPWPWPREVYGALMDFCQRGGARAVAFDVLFTEPSAYGVDDDTALATAIENGPPFVAAAFLSRDTGPHASLPANASAPSTPLPEQTLERPPALSEILSFSSATFPIAEIRDTATLLGNVAVAPDADGIFRRIAPFAWFDNHLFPTLGTAAFRAAHPDILPIFEGHRLRFGNRHIHLDRKGRALLRYRGGSQTHPTVNAAAVINSELRLREGLEPQIDPGFFQDAIVLFGFTAPGLFDLKAAPIAGVYPGVEVHATLLDNLLAGDTLIEVPALPGSLWIVALAILAGLLARCCRTALPGAVLLTGALTAPLGFGLAAYAAGFALPVAALQVALILAVIGGLLVNYAIEGHQRRFLKSAFKQYLSREVIDQLVAHPERLQLGGEERELSLFFSDIRGFTTLSEKLSPTDLTAVLNDYLTALCDIILATGGTIDKFEGDAVIAFWNAPLAQTDHAVRAVDAALRCQERLTEMSPDFERRLGGTLFTRIGLHTGPVVVGNLGSKQRFNYTFLGDAGNLASRIEGVNKVFGTRILLTAQTAERVAERFPLREIARLRVLGRTAPVTVFEPVAATPSELQRKDIERFGKALGAWYGGNLVEAAAQFESLAARDPAAAAYRERCRVLTVQALPQPWDGVWNLTEK